MGYSCSAKSSEVLDSLKRLTSHLNPDDPQNAIPVSPRFPQGGFWEIGREQPSGAITGSVFRNTHGSYHRVGSFRIDPNGRIASFPGFTLAQRKQATATGLMRFDVIHGTRSIFLSFTVQP